MLSCQYVHIKKLKLSFQNGTFVDCLTALSKTSFYMLWEVHTTFQIAGDVVH